MPDLRKMHPPSNLPVYPHNRYALIGFRQPESSKSAKPVRFCGNWLQKAARQAAKGCTATETAAVGQTKHWLTGRSLTYELKTLIVYQLKPSAGVLQSLQSLPKLKHISVANPDALLPLAEALPDCEIHLRKQ